MFLVYRSWFSKLWCLSFDKSVCKTRSNLNVEMHAISVMLFLDFVERCCFSFKFTEFHFWLVSGTKDIELQYCDYIKIQADRQTGRRTDRKADRQTKEISYYMFIRVVNYRRKVTDFATFLWLEFFFKNYIKAASANSPMLGLNKTFVIPLCKQIKWYPFFI